jgi:hypothetical protein
MTTLILSDGTEIKCKGETVFTFAPNNLEIEASAEDLIRLESAEVSLNIEMSEVDIDQILSLFYEMSLKP